MPETQEFWALHCLVKLSTPISSECVLLLLLQINLLCQDASVCLSLKSFFSEAKKLPLCPLLLFGNSRARRGDGLSRELLGLSSLHTLALKCPFMFPSPSTLLSEVEGKLLPTMSTSLGLPCHLLVPEG